MNINILLPTWATIVIIVVAVIVGWLIFKFLVTNPVISRIICFLDVIGAFVLTLVFEGKLKEAPSSVQWGAYENYMWLLTIAAILLTLSWIFLIGPVVFDEYWDGSWNITVYSTFHLLEPRMIGGFFANLVGSAVVCGGALWLTSSVHETWPFYVLIIGVFITNIIFTIIMIKEAC